MAKIPVALQLYTLRDLTKVDFPGTLKQVAAAGYKGVELAGYGNLTSAADVRKACDDAGLKVCGAHVGLESMEKDLNKAMDDQDVIGNKNLVVPALSEARRKDAAGWKQVAGSLMSIAQAAAKRGFTLSYHNHAFEFTKFDGVSGFDILWSNTDPRLVRAEVDVYWVKFGGEEPVARLTQLGSRVLLLHIKDMRVEGGERRFAPIGTGIIDFKAIDAIAQKVGVQWHIVEQDQTYGQPPMEAAKLSVDNLRKLGVA